MELEKQTCASFDVFDTIIGRRVTVPTDVFRIIEEDHNMPGFFRLRQQAQYQSNGTWDSIYNEYEQITGCTHEERERVQELELSTEESVVYLIQKNADRVKPGDIFVSDMYLPAPLIRRLVMKAGYLLPIEIYASPAGKSAGTIWPELQKKYNITLHVGDNAHSDVVSPSQHCILSMLSTAHQFNFFENYVHEHGAPICALALRQFRLQSPKPRWELGDIQLEFNLLLLIHMAHVIGKIAMSENLTNVLLCTRDCCLLKHILPVLYPALNCITFHVSRMAYRESDDVYDAYLRSVYIPGNSIIFDIHGKFESGRPTFMRVFGHLPRVHLFNTLSDICMYDGLTYTYTTVGCWPEHVNLDVVGPLLAIAEDGMDIRAPPAYDVLPAQETRDILLAFSKFIGNHWPAFHAASAIGHSDWLHMLDEAKKRSHHVTPFYKEMDDNLTLTEIANKLGTDKGTAHFCQHGYTKHYQKLFMPFNTQPVVTLLEIGLNRCGPFSAPSLDTWQAYYGSRVRTVGFDRDPLFVSTSTAPNRVIIIGDQSKPSDLAQCEQYGPFDVIIDDGSHASSHQQISLISLWPMVKPGGLYIIEDLHYQPWEEGGPLTVNMLQDWQKKTPSATPHVSESQAAEIISVCEHIKFYNSFSPHWDVKKTQFAMAVLTKHA